MLSLQQNEVHIWQADLAVASVAGFLPCLSADEVARADRFKFPIHRDRFITARGILRRLLADYLHQTADQIEFCYGDRGKPALVKREMQFNVSHSENLALYAFSRDRAVGIDLEKIREIDVESLSQRFFTTREHQTLMQLPAEHRLRPFFRYWTCKEAYLKGTGAGLGGLSGSEISLDGAAKLKSQQNWVLHELELPTEFVGAIAIYTETKLLKLTQRSVEEYCNTAQSCS